MSVKSPTVNASGKRSRLSLNIIHSLTRSAVRTWSAVTRLRTHKHVTVDQVRTAGLVNECIMFRDGLLRLPDAFTNFILLIERHNQYSAAWQRLRCWASFEEVGCNKKWLSLWMSYEADSVKPGGHMLSLLLESWFLPSGQKLSVALAFRVRWLPQALSREAWSCWTILAILSINWTTEDSTICFSLLNYFLSWSVLANVMVGMILGHCVSKGETWDFRPVLGLEGQVLVPAPAVIWEVCSQIMIQL